jgi:hypothetical protein
VRIVQRVSAWLGWAMLLAVGVLLVLEAVGAVGASWRDWIASAARWVAQPALSPWAAALLGAVLGLAALVILAAQFAPARMTRETVLVDRSAVGSTRVSAMVVRRAATQRLSDIEGIVASAPVAHGRRLALRVTLERDANAALVEEEARAALGESFWTMLGTPSQPIDITMTYSSVLSPSPTVD